MHTYPSTLTILHIKLYKNRESPSVHLGAHVLHSFKIDTVRWQCQWASPKDLEVFLTFEVKVRQIKW